MIRTVLAKVWIFVSWMGHQLLKRHHFREKKKRIKVYHASQSISLRGISTSVASTSPIPANDVFSFAKAQKFGLCLCSGPNSLICRNVLSKIKANGYGLPRNQICAKYTPFKSASGDFNVNVIFFPLSLPARSQPSPSGHFVNSFS